MTFDFDKLITIGSDKWKTAPFRFYGEKEPFFIGNKIEQKWQDIILHGTTALTLVNAKADSLEYLKLFGNTEQLAETYLDTVTLSGGCEQNGTPTPSQPLSIICNNGAIKVRHQSGLPIGYTQVEYLESSYYQYLISSYRVNNKTKLYCRYQQVTRNASQTANVIIGVTYSPSPNTANNGLVRLLSGAASFNRIGWGDTTVGSVKDITGYDSLETWYELYFDQNKMYINNVLVGTSETPVANTWRAEYGLGLFARNSSSVTMNSNARISSVWAKEDDVLVLNLIPCRRNSDSVLGMYDLVSQTFLTNQGTGDFTAGADVDDLEIYTDGTQEVVTDSVGNTASAERLLAVGDYKDTQEVLTGTVSRNVGILVLDGSENWRASATYNGSTNIPAPQGYINNKPLLCTHFVSATRPTVDYARGKCLMDGAYLSLWYSNDSTTAVTDIKQYLADQYNAGTPVIVLYPKSSATTESATPQLLLKSPVTQTSGSISNLGIAETSSSHTTPTPQQPLQINCNNGVVKVSKNLFDIKKAQRGDINTVNGTINTSILYRLTSDFIPVIVGQSYTASGKIYYENDTNKHNVSLITAFYDSDKLFIANSRVARPLTFDIPEGAYYIRVEYWVQNVGQGDVIDTERSELQFELGATATPYIPYGQIYVDGTTETVKITGNNLFNKATVSKYTLLDTSTGETIPQQQEWSWCSDFIPVSSNATYYFKSGTNYPVRIFEYTRNKSYTNTNYTVQNSSFTVGSTCKFIRFHIGQGQGGQAMYEGETMVSLGSIATTYEPYYNGGTATAENLFKVGTYQDVQSVIDGGVTRNVGIKVLDGTEDWIKSTTYAGAFYIRNVLVTWNAIRDSGGLCTHVNWYVGASNYAPNTCGIDSSFNFWNSNFGSSTTLEQFKQWISDQCNAGTPIVIVYPLATPTTETVTAQPMNIQEGSNTVSIVQASMDDLELEVKYKAGVAVTITEIENAQLDDNVEVTING